MKKILFLLLTFIIVCIGIQTIFKNSTNDTVKNTPTPEIKGNNVLDESIHYAPIVVDNITGFETSWNTTATDGNIKLNSSYDKQDVSIEYAGEQMSSSLLFHDGIPFIKGNSYVFSFNVSSTITRNLQVVFANADNGEVYFTQDYSVGEAQNISIDFKMEKDSTFNGRIGFFVGNDGSEAVKGIHNVVISNAKLINSFASDYTIKVNQIGYNIYDQKICVFPYTQGDSFDVVNVETNTVVYTGSIKNKTVNEKTGETNYIGDFTNVMTPGKYRIESQIVGTSYEFEINDNLYDSIQNQLLKMISLQRCGIALDSSWANGFTHEQCHNEEATIYGTDFKKDVTGGWHDAGDYGRYTKTGTKTLTDLLFGFLANSEIHSDAAGILESGNNIPDILDEARVELEWLLKMQTDSGEVYGKAVTPTLPGDISPDKDVQPIYLLSPETSMAGDFIGVMALASDVYREYDQEFANRCLAAAKLSWNYLVSMTNTGVILNPTEINAGEYRDAYDNDDRFYAAISLWKVTKDDSYLEAAKDLFLSDSNSANGVSWQNVGGYGRYLYLMDVDAKKDKEFYELLLESLKTEVDLKAGVAFADGYNTALTHYSWGSNGSIVEDGILFMMAYNVIGDMNYRQLAIEQLNYIFGKNALNMTFVSEFGRNSPKNMHHRLSKANNSTLVGALVGGVNADRDDNTAKLLGDNIPSAKVYLDNYNSYSTNEVTIYWNGSLINLLSLLQ